ncbi:hypothetical protein [Niallia sp. 03133]|uniref:hypothetical protein n=1 Tax=Niallia sp. 03133 TaxID=3458060 RepID=UPI004044A881
MINNLLNIMYHLNIEIKIINNKTKLIYQNTIDEKLKAEIKKYKFEILHQLRENETAKELGFLVYQHGLFYEYRYGRGAYLFIERYPNGRATAWRENHRPDQNGAYKTKIIVQNVLFERAFKEAAGFIEWLHKRQGKRVG